MAKKRYLINNILSLKKGISKRLLRHKKLYSLHVCCVRLLKRRYKNIMNPYKFMRQHQILDGLERFYKTIPWNVNWMVSKRPVETIQFAFVFVEWSRKTFRDHPNAATDTGTDADLKRFKIQAKNETLKIAVSDDKF